MNSTLYRSAVGAWASAAMYFLLGQPCLAGETLLSGFEGNLSSATGVDWTSDGGTSQAFVTSPGVTQGTQALEITQPKSPPQLVDMKLVTLNNVALVAANDKLLMDVTVPEGVGARSVWLSFRADGGLFANSPELAFLAELPERSGTIEWDYAADGLKDIAAGFSGTFWTIAIGIRGNDFLPSNQITTYVDNIRFFAVPEPGTIALLLGAIVLAPIRRRA